MEGGRGGGIFLKKGASVPLSLPRTCLRGAPRPKGFRCRRIPAHSLFHPRSLEEATLWKCHGLRRCGRPIRRWPGSARCVPPQAVFGEPLHGPMRGALPGGLPIMLPTGNMRPRDANTFIREGHPMPDSYSRRHFLKLSAALLAGGAAIAAAPTRGAWAFPESRTSAP